MLAARIRNGEVGLPRTQDPPAHRIDSRQLDRPFRTPIYGPRRLKARQQLTVMLNSAQRAVPRDRPHHLPRVSERKQFIPAPRKHSACMSKGRRAHPELWPRPQVLNRHRVSLSNRRDEQPLDVQVLRWPLAVALGVPPRQAPRESADRL